MKRFVSFIVAVLTALTLSSFVASINQTYAMNGEFVVQETDPSLNSKDYKKWNDLFTYKEKDDGTIQIFSVYDTDKNYNALTELDVPDTIDGKEVNEIADSCFREMSYVETIKLPDTIKIIGENAFYECTKLKNINIPKNLEKIGKNAFYGCELLTSIDIPESVNKIGDYVFEGCNALETINVDGKNKNYSSEDGILFNKDKSTLIKFPESSKITEYVLPDSVNEIYNWAFIGCSNITSIDISEKNLKKIGEDAFYYCVRIENMVIPEGIEKLDGAAFGYCVALKKITLPESLKSIGSYCFYGCTSLENVELPDKLEKIEDHAFYSCKSLKEVTIPDSVKTIGKYAIGFNYSTETKKEAKANGFKIHASKGTAGYHYMQKYGFTFPWYKVLIAVAVVILIIVVIIFIKWFRKREVRKLNKKYAKMRH